MHAIGELLFVVVTVFMAYSIPVAFAIWVVVTLRRIREAQEAMREQLDAIQRTIRS